MGDGEDRRFGELPLAQTVEAAAAMRRLTGMLLSLEQSNAVVDTMVAQFADWERQLVPAVLAIGTADTVAMPPERMAANRFGQRRAG